MFGIRHGGAVLRAAAGESEGGAGGGGNAEAFTEAQQTAIGTIVNAAVTGHLKRSLPSAITEGLKGLNLAETIAAEIAKVAPKPADGGEQDESKGKGGKGKGDSELETRIKDLATKLEASEAKAVAADRARVDAEQKRLLDGASAAFRNGLQPKLRPELLDVAVGHFGRELKIADDGSALIRVRRAPYKGAPEVDEDVPLAEGLPLLLAAESMKPFLPAPGGGGSEKKGGIFPNSGGSGGAGARPTVGTDPASKTIAELEARGMSIDDL